MTTAQLKETIEITALYQAAFNHLPDADGLQYWLNDMAHGMKLVDIAALFMQHPDFKVPAPSDGNMFHQDFSLINMVHQNAFHTDASDHELNHWQILFFDAVPKAEMLASFAEMSIPLAGKPADYPTWWL